MCIAKEGIINNRRLFFCYSQAFQNAVCINCVIVLKFSHQCELCVKYGKNKKKQITVTEYYNNAPF